jgi:hypothetical protein
VKNKKKHKNTVKINLASKGHCYNEALHTTLGMIYKNILRSVVNVHNAVYAIKLFMAVIQSTVVD